MATAIRQRNHTVVISSVRDNAKEAGSMSRSGVSASKEGGNRRGGSKAHGGRLGEAIDEPVGPPVDGGEQLAVAQLSHADRFVRLVRGHPHEFTGANDGGEVVPHNVRDHRPNSSERPVVVGSTGVASKGSGQEGLAVSSYGGHERAVGQHSEHGPRFG
jgi:hypothetical protein